MAGSEAQGGVQVGLTFAKSVRTATTSFLLLLVRHLLLLAWHLLLLAPLWISFLLLRH